MATKQHSVSKESPGSASSGTDALAGPGWNIKSLAVALWQGKESVWTIDDQGTVNWI